MTAVYFRRVIPVKFSTLARVCVCAFDYFASNQIRDYTYIVINYLALALYVHVPSIWTARI